MPGGYGTLDEFFESLTLIHTHKVKSFPVVVMGKEFHKKLIEHLQNIKEAGTISEEYLKMFLFTDSVQEASAYIEKNAVKKFNLQNIKTSMP